jgi:hypothetical protein
MKYRNIHSIITGYLLGLITSLFNVESTLSQSQAPMQFFCRIINGYPTTIINDPSRGEISLIQWNRNDFSSAGYTPEIRCIQVSERLNRLSQNHSLKYLTTGYLNGYPVICAVEDIDNSNNNSCDYENLVVTLIPDQNPYNFLANLVDEGISDNSHNNPMRHSRDTVIIYRTSSQIYLDIRRYIQESEPINASYDDCSLSHCNFNNQFPSEDNENNSNENQDSESGILEWENPD